MSKLVTVLAVSTEELQTMVTSICYNNVSMTVRCYTNGIQEVSTTFTQQLSFYNILICNENLNLSHIPALWPYCAHNQTTCMTVYFEQVTLSHTFHFQDMVQQVKSYFAVNTNNVLMMILKAYENILLFLNSHGFSGVFFASRAFILWV